MTTIFLFPLKTDVQMLTRFLYALNDESLVLSVTNSDESDGTAEYPVTADVLPEKLSA